MHANGHVRANGPLRSGEQTVAFRRFSDFVALDEKLARLLDGRGAEERRHALPCACMRELPPLPPKTWPWQDATAPAVVQRRWAQLQHYLDAALDRAVESHAAWSEFAAGFLGLP